MSIGRQQVPRKVVLNSGIHGPVIVNTYFADVSKPSPMLLVAKPRDGGRTITPSPVLQPLSNHEKTPMASRWNNSQRFFVGPDQRVQKRVLAGILLA